MGFVMLMIWLKALFYNIGFTHFCVAYYKTDFNSTVKKYFQNLNESLYEFFGLYYLRTSTEAQIVHLLNALAHN